MSKSLLDNSRPDPLRLGALRVIAAAAVFFWSVNCFAYTSSMTVVVVGYGYASSTETKNACAAGSGNCDPYSNWDQFNYYAPYYPYMPPPPVNWVPADPGGSYACSMTYDSGTQARATTCYFWLVGAAPASSYKGLGPPPSGQCTGNPCDAGTGNKYQSEFDYLSADTALALTRHYNSQLAEDVVGFGFGWMTPFNKHLEISGSTMQIRQAGGRGEPFSCTNNVCAGDTDTRLILMQDSSGYTLTYRDNATDRYDRAGKLLAETSSSGQITNYGYDGSGRLSTVTNHFGHKLTFGYNTSNRVATVTDPANKIIYYDYDDTYPTPVPTAPVGDLTRVRYPDNTAKLYHYNEPGLTSGAILPNHLTGISYVDANNVTTRFSSYEYYYNSSNAADPNNGKALRTEHAVTDNIGPQEKFTLAYDTATQTTVTDPVAMQEVMTFSANLGVKNLTSKANQSDGKSLQQKFDANNNLTCRKDEEGRVSTYTYNTTNQRESLTEGLAGDCSGKGVRSCNDTSAMLVFLPSHNKRK